MGKTATVHKSKEDAKEEVPMNQVTVPFPVNRIKKKDAPAVVRYMLIKGDKKPTAYAIYRADRDLRWQIQESFAKENITDMLYWDKNVFTREIDGKFETFVYRGIYIITK